MKMFVVFTWAKNSLCNIKIPLVNKGISFIDNELFQLVFGFAFSLLLALLLYVFPSTGETPNKQIGFKYSICAYSADF